MGLLVSSGGVGGGGGDRVVGAPPDCGYMISMCFHLPPPGLPAFCSLSPGIRTQVIRLEVMGHLSFSSLAPAMGSWHQRGTPESRFLMGSIPGLPAGLSVWSSYARQSEYLWQSFCLSCHQSPKLVQARAVQGVEKEMDIVSLPSKSRIEEKEM